ncbi:hypothetical protein Lepto1548_21000 (plasmid) [Leptospira interrogans serovar Bataviae]|nr:hypothetical protein Lepto1548_21000 [Leptospira interrogans serovar Bataviae]
MNRPSEGRLCGSEFFLSIHLLLTLHNWICIRKIKPPLVFLEMERMKVKLYKYQIFNLSELLQSFVILGPALWSDS